MPRKPAKRKPAAAGGRKLRRRRKPIRLPRAFRIVPLPVRGRRRKHAHVFGAAGIPPCPPGSHFVREVVIDGKVYCLYQLENGGLLLILCE
jgi:hypothetical protein